tara:strand:- start:1456 stop:3087 length:1632 start_codon:yes stop_codon:yes gene_type:complete
MTSKITEPRISITQSPIFYNKKWGFVENITLNGQAIDTGGYTSLSALQATILTTYEITDGSFTYGSFARTNVFLQSIDFAPSDYLSKIDYTIVLLCYPADYFVEEGIINPSNTWDFSENKERVLTVTHTVSAAGINTAGLDGEGFENARTFVTANLGGGSPTVPANLSMCFGERSAGSNRNPEDVSITDADLVLISRSENINRVNGEYSVTEVYELDLLQSSKSKINYSININEQAQGFHTASISGSITGGINTTLAELEVIFDAYNFIAKIEECHDITLNTTPVVRTKNINEINQSISFTLQYDDAVTNIGQDTLILELSLNENKGEDNITKYSLKGSLRGRSDLTDRWALVEEAYNSKINVYKSENVIGLFSNYYDIDEINTSYTSASVTRNKFKGEINFSVSVTNEEEPPEGFEKFDYVINIENPYFKAKPYALVGQVYLAEAETEEYVLQNLESYERAKLSISVNAVIKDDTDIEEGIKSAHGEIMNISEDFLGGDEVLTQKNIGSNPSFGKKITLNYSWDYFKSPVNSIEDLKFINIS